MIIEIVSFDLPPGTDRSTATNLYRQSAPKWAINPDLIEKFYFFDEERCVGGGTYFWKSLEAVSRWHGDDYREMVRSLYGSEPRIQILDAVIHVDPLAGKWTEI